MPGANFANRKTCGAHAKTTGLPCKGAAMPQNGRCRKHSGGARMGTNASRYKTGRYSKFLPKDIAGRYDEMVADPDVLALGADLGLLDTRLSQLIERLSDGESGLTWRRAREAYKDLKMALRDEDQGSITRAMSRLDTAFTTASGVEATWRDVRDLVQERRLLAESERRRLVDLHQMVTVEELLLFMGKAFDVIDRHVDDDAVKRKIGREIDAMLSARPKSNRPAPAITVASSVVPPSLAADPTGDSDG